MAPLVCSSDNIRSLSNILPRKEQSDLMMRMQCNSSMQIACCESFVCVMLLLSLQQCFSTTNIASDIGTFIVWL